MHVQDPEGFVEDGGWSFLDQEGGSDAEGEEDESEGDGACALSRVNAVSLVMATHTVAAESARPSV